MSFLEVEMEALSDREKKGFDDNTIQIRMDLIIAESWQHALIVM